MTDAPRSKGAPSGGRRAAHFFGGGYHTLAVSPKGRRFKNYMRDTGSGAAGAAPGLAVSGTGLALAARDMRHIDDAKGKGKLGMIGPGMMIAGIPAATVGAQLARQKNLTSMNRQGYLKAEEKKVKKNDSVSAFGVDHGEVSKGIVDATRAGAKALKFKNALSVPKVAGRSYKAGIKRGQTKTNAAIQAGASAIRHSPGTALVAGGAGTAAVGGTGYAVGRRKD